MSERKRKEEVRLTRSSFFSKERERSHLRVCRNDYPSAAVLVRPFEAPIPASGERACQIHPCGIDWQEIWTQNGRGAPTRKERKEKERKRREERAIAKRALLFLLLPSPGAPFAASNEELTVLHQCDRDHETCSLLSRAKERAEQEQRNRGRDRGGHRRASFVRRERGSREFSMLPCGESIGKMGSRRGVFRFTKSLPLHGDR